MGGGLLMRIRGGGGGGGGGIPGVTSDGNTPGGVVIAGRILAGVPATAALIFNRLVGNTTFTNTQSMLDDDDDVMDIEQGGTLSKNNNTYTVFIIRDATLNGFNFLRPMVVCDDETASNVPIAQFQKQSVTQFQVDPDGIRVHGKLKTGASVAHVLGAYSGNAVPIYDESGTLLGYMPLYA